MEHIPYEKKPMINHLQSRFGGKPRKCLKKNDTFIGSN